MPPSAPASAATASTPPKVSKRSASAWNMTMLQAVGRAALNPAVGEKEQNADARRREGAARRRLRDFRLRDVQERIDGGDLDRAGRAESNPGSEICQQQAAGNRADHLSDGAERLAGADLLAAVLAIAELGEEDVIAGPVEYLRERRDGAEQQQRRPDAVHQRNGRVLQSGQQRPDDERAPQADRRCDDHHQRAQRET